MEKKIIFIPKKKIIKKNRLQQKMNLEPNYNKIIEYLDKNYIYNNYMEKNNKSFENINIFSLEPNQRNWNAYEDYLKSNLKILKGIYRKNIEEKRKKILKLLIHLFVEINDSIPKIDNDYIRFFLIDFEKKGNIHIHENYKILALSGETVYDKNLFEELISNSKIINESNFGCSSWRSIYRRTSLRRYKLNDDVLCIPYSNNYIIKLTEENILNGLNIFLEVQELKLCIEKKYITELKKLPKNNQEIQEISNNANSIISKNEKNIESINFKNFKNIESIKKSIEKPNIQEIMKNIKLFLKNIKFIIIYQNKNAYEERKFIVNNYNKFFDTYPSQKLKRKQNLNNYTIINIKTEDINKVYKNIPIYLKKGLFYNYSIFFLTCLFYFTLAVSYLCILAIDIYIEFLILKMAMNYHSSQGGSKNIIRKFSIIQLGNKKVKMGNTNIKYNQSPINAALNLLKDIQSSSIIKKLKISKIKFYIKENTVGSKNKIFGPYIGYLKKSIVKKEIKKK